MKSVLPGKAAGIEETSDKAATALFWDNPPESDAPPPTGDDTPRSFEDLDKIPF